MQEVLRSRLSRLLCVKSLATGVVLEPLLGLLPEIPDHHGRGWPTLLLTVVFAVLALRGEVGQDFMTVYTVIVAFYFGTQVERTARKGDGGE